VLVAEALFDFWSAADNKIYRVFAIHQLVSVGQIKRYEDGL